MIYFRVHSLLIEIDLTLVGELALIGVEVADSLSKASSPDTSGFTDLVAQITSLTENGNNDFQEESLMTD